MKASHIPFIVLLSLLLPLAAAAQMPAVAEKFTQRDTLRVRTLYADLSLLMSLSDDEMASHTDIRAAGGAHLRYVFGRSDIDLLARSEVERGHDRDISYSSFLPTSRTTSKRR